ncbi:MAG: hypothetical protein P0Y53_14145 [Candidatus Pseudobacter hemicellulosilyticus]|uniref:Uncharacterized protein n=1 Tax=Candidatus Pseudobacter hemicellulosilyticus TaxID=3121375 RepID=A0AAJ5WPI4_9BACT|nr:MAG: hypothetical protein P0Y53_14145 [Pseudobacter sp.]
MSLYNNALFPEYIFNKRLSILFFDFYACFSTEFILTFKKYLEKIGISKIIIRNIEPELLQFNRTIETADLPDNFEQAVKSIMSQNYIDSEVSLYMMTELFELTDSLTNASFSLVLNRAYDVGVFGTLKNSFTELFDEFEIKDVRSYLSALQGVHYTDALDNKLKVNYS